MRYLAILLLAACVPDGTPELAAECTLVQTDEHPDYVSCIEANTGERMFFSWSDIQPVIAAGGHASFAWVEEHRLPDEWFGPDGLPVEGAFG